ncbi:MAG TPA: bifunctional phosphopantothenoylcysteine decarboxylase/phosphopantothenate--cysteine ligase CoaBC [Usitatibacter sp.]|jgi:phosphopantothenoylcysteine decarboxylase/phosphopantothenate--cysteine ligase|nr:bifunctional phosphopantothenoylcysteine decarboxylase/phosphopantothenate--cysteine ligase CoaBC [Usitatibacter sp.]
MDDVVMDRRLLLGVTGGIAAYKAAELARLLQRNNVDVRVAMTSAATRFVGPSTFQALTGKPVALDLWDASVPNAMSHIELSRGVNAILVAPASANFLAKVAQGIADDLLSTTCLARNCPLLVAPAMNREMWDAPATQRNVAQLRADGVSILGPAAGEQACGETGLGRMLEADELLGAVLEFFAPKRLTARRVVVTAGPTFEAIDTVRGITNLSSGKMGYAIAEAAAAQGAEVTLVSGPTALKPPPHAHFVYVTTAAEMLNAVKAHLPGADLFFSVAAVADYTPVATASRKLKKSGEPLELQLKPTEDILAYVAGLDEAPFCVGFAAETENLADYAQAKRLRKNIPMIVANLLQNTLGQDENEVTIYDERGAHPLARAAKSRIAQAIVSHAVDLMESPTRHGRARLEQIS